MQRLRLISVALLLLWTVPVCGQLPAAAVEGKDFALAPTDWPWWRGPDRNGIAHAQQQPPLQWSATENVVWQSLVPGRGHGSPTVVGDRVFLATADDKQEIQSVLCYQRQSGKLLWQTEVHRGGLEKNGHAKHSHASSTLAGDGSAVFVNFLNRGAIYTTALSIEGKQLWQTKIVDYVMHFGYGSSPALYGGLVIVTADHKGGGLVAALDRGTGKVVWSEQRPRGPNHVSPIILPIAGRDQLMLTGYSLLVSLDPASGKKLWECKGPTSEGVAAAVTDGKHIFVGGVHPTGHIAAIRGDGSGTVAWRVSTGLYVPSMLVDHGYLYAVTDTGIALCLNAETGEEAWKVRLHGGFSASLVLAGKNIFATNEAGQTTIFKANPEKFELIGKNQLGEGGLATPSICGGRIYMRVAVQQQGRRQEILYCLGTR
ncbi:MAG: PQQ-binding-like beta-propeller repeat protein [Planctomycetia bacterium]|nr:PQQ-binding-like beta-propeller repeat protein [Planctomycetia bacterium]